MLISNASFLENSEATTEDVATFKWAEQGNVFVHAQGIKKNSADNVWATWLIGRDQDFSDYSVLYYDNRNVTRVYNMSFDNNVLKIWRNSPNFSQRFEAVLSKDKNTISGSWKKSVDGKKWNHDFDITYTRVSD